MMCAILWPAEASESVAVEEISLESEMNDEVEAPRVWQLVRELDLFQVKCDRRAVEAQWMQAVVEVELYERLLKEIVHQVGIHMISLQRAASMIMRIYEKRAEGILCTLSAIKWLKNDIVMQYSSDMGLARE